MIMKKVSKKQADMQATRFRVVLRKTKEVVCFPHYYGALLHLKKHGQDGDYLYEVKAWGEPFPTAIKADYEARNEIWPHDPDEDEHCEIKAVRMPPQGTSAGWLSREYMLQMQTAVLMARNEGAEAGIEFLASYFEASGEMEFLEDPDYHDKGSAYEYYKKHSQLYG